MSVDKILALAQNIVTILLTLPQTRTIISKTILMKQHQRIDPLFADDFWVTRQRSQEKKVLFLINFG